MKTGLFFGSFNPVHIGHMAIANYFVEYSGLQQVWFVVSPQNPFKKKVTLLADFARYDLLEIAIGSDERFSVCDIEFHLPRPSYTIDTLTYLTEKFPVNEFILIIGSDNLAFFHKWKNYARIEEKYTRYVYPRSGPEKVDREKHKNAVFFEAPLIEISSSFIRDALSKGRDIRHFLPAGVYESIVKQGYYM